MHLLAICLIGGCYYLEIASVFCVIFGYGRVTDTYFDTLLLLLLKHCLSSGHTTPCKLSFRLVIIKATMESKRKGTKGLGKIVTGTLC